MAAHLHPGWAADLHVGGKPAGSFGELHPTAALCERLTARARAQGLLRDQGGD